MGNFNGLPKTTNIQLNKPGYDNAADIEALNENADIIDALLQRLLLLTDNIKKLMRVLLMVMVLTVTVRLRLMLA